MVYALCCTHRNSVRAPEDLSITIHKMVHDGLLPICFPQSTHRKHMNTKQQKQQTQHTCSLGWSLMSQLKYLNEPTCHSVLITENRDWPTFHPILLSCRGRYPMSSFVSQQFTTELQL